MGCQKLSYYEEERALESPNFFMRVTSKKRVSEEKCIGLYPFGSVARRSKTNEETHYRYGYQGEFSEEDEETGWNSFELRMLDPVLGRWTTIDPKRVGFTPYWSMNNNPISLTDPDGGDPNQGVNSNGDVVFDDGKDDGNVFLVNDDFTGSIDNLATLKANSVQLFSGQEFIGTSTQLENYVLSQFKFTGLQSFPTVSTDINAGMNGLSVASRKARIGANGDYEVRGKPYSDWVFSIYSAKGTKSTLFSNVYNLRNSLEHESYHAIQTIGIMHNYNEWKPFASEKAYKQWSEHGAINYQRNHKSFNWTTPGYSKTVQRYYNFYK